MTRHRKQTKKKQNITKTGLKLTVELKKSRRVKNNKKQKKQKNKTKQNKNKKNPHIVAILAKILSKPRFKVSTKTCDFTGERKNKYAFIVCELLYITFTAGAPPG